MGRTSELGQLKRAAESSRLVVVTGPAGIGKSRLIYRFASTAKRDLGRRTALLTLDRSRSLADLREACRELLDGSGDSGNGPRRQLLMIDRVEYTTGGDIADLIEELLQTRPELHVMIASRSQLGLTGEQVFALGPLQGPSTAVRLLLDGRPADVSEAEQLLEERARLLIPSFVRRPRDAALIASSCLAVDCVPLALETVARALTVFSLTQLDDALRDDLTVLEDFDLEGRKSLRAVTAEMFDAVTEPQRTLCRSLSVFGNEFDLEAAAQISGIDRAARPALARDLAALCRASLIVRFDGQDDGPSFRMLAPYRRRARMELDDSAAAEMVVGRQRSFLRHLLASAAEGWSTSSQSTWTVLLTRFADDVYRLLDDLSARRNSAAEAIDLVSGLRHYWLWRASERECRPREWVRAALRNHPDADLIRLRALHVDAYLALFFEDPDGARDRLLEARRLASALGEHGDDVFGSFVEGFFAVSSGQLADAEAAFAQSLNLSIELGERTILGEQHWYLALVRVLTGRLEEAAELCRTSKAALDEAGDSWGSAYVLWMMALIAFRAGEGERAMFLARECVVVMTAVNDRSAVTLCIRLMASIATERGDLELAARLIGAAPAQGLVPELALTEVRPSVISNVRDALGGRVFTRIVKTTEVLPSGEAIDFAIDSGGFASHQVPQSEAGGLTARELEIAELVGNGYSNADVATALFISRRTVEGHVQRILTKLQVKSRSQVTVWFQTQQRV